MNPGDLVVYEPEGGPKEAGFVTGLSGSLVMVRYGMDLHAKATRPEDLRVVRVEDL